MPIFLSRMNFLYEYWFIWKLNPNCYIVFNGQICHISLQTVELVLKTVAYDQQKIHMKLFRKIFITRKSPFVAVSLLILSLDHSFFRWYRMKRQYLTVIGERYLQILPFHGYKRVRRNWKHNFYAGQCTPHIYTDQLKKYLLLFVKIEYKQTFCKCMSSKIASS